MDHDFTLETQARDVLALLDHAQVERAHLMGICGGAVVALCSGCLDPERIVSLSLWHGDFNTGDGELLTRYQADLRWLMSEAAESRESAIALQNTLNNRNALARIRRELAHFLFYPYTNGELLYRYARANGAIMHADVMKYADRIHQKTLVVASEDDQTAHPMGSKRVCARLRNAQLSMTHGQHLCCFDALEPAQRLAEAFIAESFK